MPCENVPKHATTDAPTLIKSYPHKPDSFLSMALIFLWLGATLIYTVLIASIVLAPSKTVRMALIGLVVLLAVLPLPKSPLTKNPIHKLGYSLATTIMEHAATYFGLSVFAASLPSLQAATKTHCTPGDGGLIIPLCPHDILPYAIFAFNPSLKIFGKSGFGREGEMHGLMTGVLFKIPYVRHLYSYVCAGDVGKANFTRILREGGTALFVPGGVQEALLLNDEMMRDPESKKIFLYLNKRKGFVKLALQNGSGIVPTFAFGVDGSFSFKVMPGPKWLISKIARVIGFVPMIYFGRYMIPLGIARPNKITVCVGTPISTKKSAEPTQEEIEKVHAEFVEGVVKVFEENKKRVGYGERELVIV